MPLVQDEPAEAAEPLPGLDRLSFFPHLRRTMPNLVRDTFNRNPDDLKFQQLVDDATLRYSKEMPDFV